jgi:hypothetical protein
MKTNLTRTFLFLTMVAIFSAAIWSCKDDDPTLDELRNDRLAYLQDSIRISDSLNLTNNAGIVNYTIVVVDGSTSSIFNNPTSNGRTQKTAAVVGGAVVTIGQYGKIVTDTTDASGMVVFNGFFRSAATVTIQATDYTSVSYISAVHIQDSTRTGTISFVGNLIPIFPTAGANTATISGQATIQTDLTNQTRELVPDGTTFLASIDATNGSSFSNRFLTVDIADEFFESACGCQFSYVGSILQSAYTTGTIGTVAGGSYSITVPSAIDGLPINIDYSSIAATQTLFENSGTLGQHTITNRTQFLPVVSPLAALPASSSVTVGFVSNSATALANAVISPTLGTLNSINVTAGGSGYNGTPLVQITGGGGSGATGTVTVTNGVVTGATLTNPGSGYTATPAVTLISGAGAVASAGLQANGTVVSVGITNSGSGYTVAPAVTFNPPPPPGVTALGTANIDALGRVVSISITNAGSGYTADPGAVTIGAPPAGGVQATADAFYSGQSVGNVTVTGGANYTYAPAVTFSAPQRPGTTATGTASFDPITRTVTGIQVTNAGSGYTAPPTVTLNAGSGAAVSAELSGGTVISVDITNQGADYAYPPIVEFDNTGTGGGGATGTAVMSNGTTGKVVGVTITSGGAGYTIAPAITFVVGDDANAFATVVNGVITAITVTDGGRNFVGAPRVVITSGDGGGATATATVAGGQITGVTITTGGSGYLPGNVPATEEAFNAVGTFLDVKPGLTYINDVYYGTGTFRNPN